MKFPLPYSKITIFIIMVVMTIISSNLNWGKERWKEIVKTDGKGYYAYLPAVFIYDDLNFVFFDQIEKEKYYNQNTYYDYRGGGPDGVAINKYYSGTALAQTPFFLTAHLVTKISGGDTDGYSKWYMIFVNIAALFYLFVGLWFLNKTLIFYEISDVFRAFSLIIAVFGTNLFFYVVGESSVSHVFSFGFIAMFVYYSKSYFIRQKPMGIVLLGLLLGMIVLIRPVNGLILFSWPFLAGSITTLKEGIVKAFRNYKYLLLAVIGFFLIISVQLIFYKISTGDFWVYSYGEEGFNWSDPHFFDILFSYRKGLFLYTPIYLVSLFGLYYFWKNRKLEMLSWIGFFLLITYVFSSWWMWYYGGSFSSRVYVEFIPVFMILMAVALQNVKPKPIKTSFISIIVALIVLCQIQIFQYRYYKIHWSDMTEEMYWDVFLRVDQIKD